MALSGRKLKELRTAAVGASGNRVSCAMALAGLTQVQLAEAIGETQPFISDIARGRYGDTTIAKARKFAEYFGCSIEDLFPSEREAKAS